jgi:hypothetical protein
VGLNTINQTKPKKSCQISKWLSKAVIPRRTDDTMKWSKNNKRNVRENTTPNTKD